MNTASSPDTSRPAGRDDVIRRLLRATERLCETRQPSSFTVREIAAEAETAASLLYFYFDSKDDLIIETMRAIASDIDAAAAAETDPGAMALAVSHLLAKRPAFPRIAAWLALEGRSVTKEMGDHPLLRRIMTTLATRDAPDPATDTAVILTSILGNSFFRPGVNEAIERDPDDDRLVDALDQSLSSIISSRNAEPRG